MKNVENKQIRQQISEAFNYLIERSGQTGTSAVSHFVLKNYYDFMGTLPAVYHMAYLGLVGIVGKQISNESPTYKLMEKMEQDDFFPEELQDRYPVRRNKESALVLLENLTDEELVKLESRYRKTAGSVVRHADAIAVYRKSRNSKPEAA